MNELNARVRALQAALNDAKSAVAREKDEVQLAVAHAQRAGKAADEANDLLLLERASLAQDRKVLAEERERCAKLEKALSEAHARMEDLEEDLDTERQWRESGCQLFARWAS